MQSCAIALGLVCFVLLMEEAMHSFGFFYQVNQAIWWPTNGVALALMLRNERPRWSTIMAGILAGSWIEAAFHGSPLTSRIVNSTANFAGPMLAALVLPLFKKLEDWLLEPRLVLRYVLFALVLAPALSATILASNVHLYLSNVRFWHAFQIRAVSDMLGYAMFAPLVLVATSRETYHRVRARYLLTLFLLLAAVVGVTYAVFWQTSYPVAFVLITVVLLCTLRAGFAAAVFAVNLLAVLATIATMHGRGPLIFGEGIDINHRVLLLQIFLVLVMVTVFSVSVLQTERRIFYERLQAAYKEKEKQATTDALTSLANRRLLEETLKIRWAQAAISGAPLALLTIDVDHFKSYNDRFGHPAGDACLRRIAKAIQELEHHSADLLARYGGEEFLYLLTGVTLENAAQVAESIRVRVEALKGDPEIAEGSPVSVSIGCAAITPRRGISPQMLISASDEALYRAKRNGRNRVEIANSPDSDQNPTAS